MAASCSFGPHGPITISIIGTNDLHGGVLGDRGRGGLALLDGYLRNLRAARARDGGAVLLLDAGDLFQGTLESNLNEGAVVIAAYNAMRYDAAAIGNHEFDFGPVGPAVSPQSPTDDPIGALKARVGEARFPFLAANIIDKNDRRPVSWPNVKPSTMVTVAGVKIGIVGLATVDTLGATLSANTRDLEIAPLAPTLEAEARVLRDKGATVVVAVAHAGGRCTMFDDPSDLSSCADNAEIFEVARALTPGLVNVIVAGHRHEGIAHEVTSPRRVPSQAHYTVAVISSYSGGRAFGRVDLSIDPTNGQATSHHIFPPHEICALEDPSTGKCSAPTSTMVQTQYEGLPVTPSPEIESILAPAVEAARVMKARPLNATVADTLPDSGNESALGNLLADWMRLSAGADVAIANSGGVRAALPAGPITYGRLFEVTPFDNRDARLTLTGAELTTVVRENLQRRGDMVVLSGVRATATCGRGILHVSLRRESGKPVADRDVLQVVTSDFLATEGSGIFSPVIPFRGEAKLDGPVLRDEIADWLTRTGGEWRSQSLYAADKRRLTFEGSRPVSCAGGR